MADTPFTGPALAPNSPASAAPTPTPTGGAAGVTQSGAPQSNDLLTVVERLNADIRERDERIKGLHTVLGKQSQELGVLRPMIRGGHASPADASRGNGGGDAWDFPVAPQTVPESRRSPLLDDPVYEMDRKRREIGEFFGNYPMDEKTRSGIQAVSSDPYLSSQFEVRDAYGRIDFYRSYESIYSALELRRYREAEAKAREAGITQVPSAATTPPLPRTAGMLSGTSAVVGPEPFDPGRASAADVLIKGGLQYDPNDPPGALRG